MRHNTPCQSRTNVYPVVPLFCVAGGRAACVQAVCGCIRCWDCSTTAVLVLSGASGTHPCGCQSACKHLRRLNLVDAMSTSCRLLRDQCLVFGESHTAVQESQQESIPACVCIPNRKRGCRMIVEQCYRLFCTHTCTAFANKSASTPCLRFECQNIVLGSQNSPM